MMNIQNIKESKCCTFNSDKWHNRLAKKYGALPLNSTDIAAYVLFIYKLVCIPSKEQRASLQPLCLTAMKLLPVWDGYTCLLVKTNPTLVTTVQPILLWTSSSSHNLSLESLLTLVRTSFSLQVSATGTWTKRNKNILSTKMNKYRTTSIIQINWAQG